MPLLHISLAFLCGVFLSAWVAQPGSTWLGLAAAALFLTLLAPFSRRLLVNSPFHTPRIFSVYSGYSKKLSPLPISLLLAVLLLGAARYAATRFDLTPAHVAYHNDHDGRVELVGVIAGSPERRDRFTLVEVQAESLSLEADGAPIPTSGRVLAKVPLGKWRYGDRIGLTGWLRTPFETEEFSYLDYLAHRGIHSTFDCPTPLDERCAQVLGTGGGRPVYRVIYALRERLVEVLFRLFPDPEASLLAGILLGVEGTIPAEVREAFNITGTAHIIAISGFNFAVIAGLFAALFSRLFGRWRGMFAAVLGIALYAVLAGAGAGIVRAAIMGGLSVFAAQVGRRSHGLNSLVFVAALMALHDPHVLWDISFQLSFMATLGLILYADPLDGWFRSVSSPHLPPAWVERLAGPVGEYFLFTLAAQLTTLPLILFYFQRLSLASMVANPLVLPAQPPVMVLGGLAALLGLAWMPLGQLAAHAAWPFVVYTIRVIEALARLPGGSLALDRFDPAWLVIFYAILFGWTAFGGRIGAWVSARSGGSISRLAWAGLLVVLLGNVYIWRLVLAAPDGRLHLTVLDVSVASLSGDAFLIQTPSGRSVLIDGGPSPAALSDALGRRLPLGKRALDYWVVAAAGDEQLTALLPAVDRFTPGQVLWSGPADAAYSARQLNAALVEAGVPIIEARTDHTLNLGGGARLEFLAVTPKGAVLLLEQGKFRALLPVGLDFETMETLISDREQPPVTALLLAGGGYAPLNPPEWIEKWQPQLALLSVAAGEKLGRPDAEVVEALEGYTLLRTDRNGWIELSTDGERLWVEVERR